MPKTKKKVAKKSPVPKPSTLLARALALFGPKGENWIQRAEKNELEAGFVDIFDLPKNQRKGKALLNALKDANRLTEDAMAEIVQDELREIANSVDIYDIESAADLKEQLANAQKELAAKEKELKGRFVETPAHIAFCSIGAICEINTPNETMAANFLAKAIQADFDVDYEYSDARGVIIPFNDDNDTTWAKVKAKFEKAIKLAKAAGK